MIEGTTTKSLGIALRSLYPGAFASYQGIIFRVISPGQEVLSGITEDSVKSEKVQDMLEEYPLLAKKVYAIISKEVQRDTGVILPTQEKRPIRIKVPGKVDLRIDDRLEKVYCTNPRCGTLWKVNWLNQRAKSLPPCSLCGSRVQQAPVFVPIIDQDPGTTIGAAGILLDVDIQSLPDRAMFCHYRRPDNSCTSPQSIDHQCVSNFRDRLGSLVVIDPQRPIESLKICNPDCPKGFYVPPIDIPRPRRTSEAWYSLDFPRESMSVPLSASGVISYEDPEDPEIQEVNEVLQHLMGQFFNSNLVDFNETKFTHMKILETVYGYRIGTRLSGVTTTYIGLDKKTVMGRVTNTKGFQVTLKPTIYEKIKQIKEKMKSEETEEEFLEIILHSLKHALLVEVPLFTGLDENKFHGTYEINETKEEWAARVYVYDTEDGGSGGFSTIMRNREILETMLDDIRLRRLNCPVRECKQACKHCLYIRNCGFVNRRLHRKLLIDSGIFQMQ